MCMSMVLFFLACAIKSNPVRQKEDTLKSKSSKNEYTFMKYYAEGNKSPSISLFSSKL